MKKEVLKIRKEKLQKQHEDWIKKKAILNALKELNKLSIDQNQKDIIKQKQVWEEAGEQYGKELGSEIAEQLKLKEEAIKTESSKVKHFEQHLTDKLQLIEDMSISKNVKKFFEDIQSLDDLKEMSYINLNHSQLTSFVPGEIVQSYFGSIQNKNKDKIIRIKAITEYNTKLCLVTNILQCYKREAKDTRGTNNTFWIHGDQLETLQKITLQPDSTIKVLSQINEFSYDTVLTRNGDLLISDQTSNLKILKGNGKDLTASKYNFKSYIVWPIHINSENQLIVGAVKKLPVDYSVPSESVVFVMDMEGNHQTKYEFDKNNEPLLTHPTHITTTKNGNIFIIDLITEDYRGRIVTLEKGTVRNIYSGHGDINSQNHPFKPQSIVATQKDNIILSDMYNNTLHILDDCGHLLFYCNTMEYGVMGPSSMAFIETGKLLIGCSTPLISANNAKIYEVEISKDI